MAQLTYKKKTARPRKKKKEKIQDKFRGGSPTLAIGLALGLAQRFYHWLIYCPYGQ